jgi:hypothetical protein
MRTNWGQSASARIPALLPEYDSSVGAFINATRDYWGHETTDPAKVAQVILRLAESAQLPAHLLIGSDAVEYAAQAEEKRSAEGRAWREVSLSTDADQAQGKPNLEFRNNDH